MARCTCLQLPPADVPEERVDTQCIAAAVVEAQPLARLLLQQCRAQGPAGRAEGVGELHGRPQHPLLQLLVLHLQAALALSLIVSPCLRARTRPLQGDTGPAPPGKPVGKPRLSRQAEEPRLLPGLQMPPPHPRCRENRIGSAGSHAQRQRLWPPSHAVGRMLRLCPPWDLDPAQTQNPACPSVLLNLGVLPPSSPPRLG